MLKMSNRGVTIFLNGGLGNQLFQLHAALYLAGGERVTLDGRFLRDGGIHAGKPVLDYCDLPQNVSFSPLVQSSWIQIKVHNLILRLSTTRKKNFVKNVITKIVIFLLKSYNFGLLNDDGNYLIIGDGIGYSELENQLVQEGGNPVLIGYFQSYVYAESCCILKNSQTNNKKCAFFPDPGPKLRPINEVLIHLRYGDFRSDPKFRVLDGKFLTKAIQVIQEQSTESLNFKVITNEAEFAESVLESIPQYDFEILEFPDLNPFEMISEMSKFQTILISNSTFSWWAAYTSDAKTKVYYPSPWFQVPPEPYLLIPDNWVEISATESI